MLLGSQFMKVHKKYQCKMAFATIFREIVKLNTVYVVH